jgi:hypothetical protein
MSQDLDHIASHNITIIASVQNDPNMAPSVKLQRKKAAKFFIILTPPGEQVEDRP